MTMIRRVLLSAAATVAAAGPAWAHHGMDDATPQTLAQGFLSGLAHPVIGPDHLAFVIGIGILAAFASGGWILPAVFLGMGAIGTAIHLTGISLPASKILVGLTVLLMAGAVLMRRQAPPALLVALCGLGGLAHGYALAESIVGAEPTPLSSYLAGLVVIQLAISLAVREGVVRMVGWRPLVADRALVAASGLMLVAGSMALILPS